MFKKIALSAGLLSVAAASQAAIDTKAVESALTDAGAAAQIVCGAVIVVIVGIKAFSFIKSALGR